MFRKWFAMMTPHAISIIMLVNDQGDTESIRPKTKSIWKKGKFDTFMRYIKPIVIP